MRFKYYLRGCGLGIVLTAVILMISFHRSGGEQMSDAEIMHRASELGMVTPEELEPDPVPAAPTQAKDEGEDAGTAAEPEPTEGAGEPPEQEDGQESTEAESEEQAEEEPEKDVVEKITIVVRQGDVCREIVRELEKQGLVPDAEEFSLYMYENGFDNQIRAGAYTFTVGMDQEEIAKILTAKPE